MELAAGGPDLKQLRKIAAKHIAAAEARDMQAIRELVDRLDGRPAQAIVATLSGEVESYIIFAEPMTEDEWEAAYGRSQ